MLGFTGTQRGMSAAQMHLVRRFLEENRPEVVHHGGCVGADMEFDAIAEDLRIRRVLWPGDSPEKYGWDYSYTGRLQTVRPNLVRNSQIVRVSHHVLATPRSGVHRVCRHGTCWTVRRALKLRDVTVIARDGHTTTERRPHVEPS